MLTLLIRYEDSEVYGEDDDEGEEDEEEDEEDGEDGEDEANGKPAKGK